MNKLIFRNIRDFDLTHIFECGQCFRWIPADDGSGDYIGAAGSYAARISFAPDHPHGGAGDECTGTLTIEATGGDEDFWYDYFDLGTDYKAIKNELAANDRDIRPALEYGYGIRILNQDLFETIISFIISQNNNIPRIRKNIESICSVYGKPIGEAFGREWYAFPEPDALAAAEVDDLMGLRLGYRAGYIKAAGERFTNCPAPGCREEILSYLGIGPKVANCIMLFGLRCTEAFPIDTWVKHIMNDMYGFDEKDVRGMADFASEKFASYAGYAQQYLFFFYRDNGK